MMMRRGLLLAFCGFAASAGMLGLLVVGSGRSGAEPIVLAPDERALIEQVGKSTPTDTKQFGRAPSAPIGAEIVLPLQDGSITLVRTSSFVREDGSISWRGIVKETGER